MPAADCAVHCSHEVLSSSVSMSGINGMKYLPCEAKLNMSWCLPVLSAYGPTWVLCYLKWLQELQKLPSLSWHRVLVGVCSDVTMVPLKIVP